MVDPKFFDKSFLIFSISTALSSFEEVIGSYTIEYREKNIDTGEEKTEIVLPHKEIKIPPRIAHLLIALEDSVFVETITDINDVTIVPEYRKIVNESMNIKKLN